MTGAAEQRRAALIVTCWCETHGKEMTSAEVRAGAGWSCGKKGCNPEEGPAVSAKRAAATAKREAAKAAAAAKRAGQGDRPSK